MGHVREDMDVILEVVGRGQFESEGAHPVEEAHVVLKDVIDVALCARCSCRGYNKRVLETDVGLRLHIG